MSSTQAARRSGKASARPHRRRLLRLLASGRLRSPASAWQAINGQISTLSRRLIVMAHQDKAVKRLMTAPGVGVLVALTYTSVIDDPQRFAKSSNVGAYVGLTPRRFQSGEEDYTGRISKHGDALLRAAAHLSVRGSRDHSAPGCEVVHPESMGTRLAKRVGAKKAAITMARKFAGILHRMWKDGSEFRWSANEAHAA